MVVIRGRDTYLRQQMTHIERLAEASYGQHASHNERPAFDLTTRSSSMQAGHHYLLDGADNGRNQAGPQTPRRQPPMRIDEALKSRCGIIAKQYFIAAIKEDGELMTFFSPAQRLHEDTVRQFFDAATFQEVMVRIASDPDSGPREPFGSNEYHRPSEYNRNRTLEPQRIPGLEDCDDSVRCRRKRRRAHDVKTEKLDPLVTVTSRKGIKVADLRATRAFYEARFTKCQQEVCKEVVKEWIKAIEPKKQSSHPYTQGEKTVPDWWPKETYPGQDKVRHKEPDHIFRAERITLLTHILRLAMEPYSKQHPAFQKAGLNVKKLEQLAFKRLSSFFEKDKKNSKKRPYVVEIFKVARAEERYKNGEIDGSTEILVQDEEEMSPGAASPASPGKSHDQHEFSWPKLNETLTTQHAQSSPRSLAHPGHLANELPLRSSQFPGPVMADAAAQQHGFSESSGVPIQVQGQTVSSSEGCVTIGGVSSPHDSSRRPSQVYSDYSTSTNAAVVYSQPWQPGSTSTTASPLYAYTPTHSSPTHSQPATYVQHPVQMNSDSAYTVGSYDGSLRPMYNPSPNAMFRSAAMDHTPPTSQTTYGYVSEDGQGLRAVAPGMEAVPRNHLH
ncbi:hypothetical protein S40288_10187 [Stachybotrys chartarum IBT 40288]|nr:hypothetical protein S40288_10187 [Stachybotrys chartarum IBT 40288]